MLVRSGLKGLVIRSLIQINSATATGSTSANAALVTSILIFTASNPVSRANALILLALFILGVMVVTQGGSTTLWTVFAAALVLGAMFVLPIGGAEITFGPGYNCLKVCADVIACGFHTSPRGGGHQVAQAVSPRWIC